MIFAGTGSWNPTPICCVRPVRRLALDSENATKSASGDGGGMLAEKRADDTHGELKSRGERLKLARKSSDGRMSHARGLRARPRLRAGSGVRGLVCSAAGSGRGPGIHPPRLVPLKE